jgi:preprotein translocase subunit Sec63
MRRAYKKLALAYHPDKHRADGEEQRAAIQDKFKQARAQTPQLAARLMLQGWKAAPYYGAPASCLL